MERRIRSYVALIDLTRAALTNSDRVGCCCKDPNMALSAGNFYSFKRKKCDWNLPEIFREEGKTYWLAYHISAFLSLMCANSTSHQLLFGIRKCEIISRLIGIGNERAGDYRLSQRAEKNPYHTSLNYLFKSANNYSIERWLVAKYFGNWFIVLCKSVKHLLVPAS